MAAQPVKWIGVCEFCTEASPELRDSETEALQDAADCPCRDDLEPADA